MRSRHLALVASLGMACLLAAAPAARAGREKWPGWHDDYARAREEARRTGKPLFVVFRCVP